MNPEMMAAMGGMASGSGPGAPVAPPDMGPPPDQGPDPASILTNILDLADQFRQVEEDHTNLLAMEQVRTLVQKILANEQKMHDDLLQGKASPQAMRRYA